MILVQNTRPCLVGIAGQRFDTSSEPVHIKFMPGVNSVEPSVWEVIKENPLVKTMLTRGDLLVNGLTEIDFDSEMDAEVETISGDDLSSVPVRLALGIIRSTFDKKLIEKWQETETRSKITSVLESQLRKLAAEPSENEG